MNRLIVAGAAALLLTLCARAQEQKPDFTASTVTPSKQTVYPLDTVDFEVVVENRGAPPFNWVEVSVDIPTSAMFASAGPEWKYDAAARRLTAGAEMPERRRTHRFTLLAMPETEGNIISPGVVIRYGADSHWMWPRIEVDSRPANVVFRLGGLGFTPAAVVVFGFLGILGLAMVVSWIIAASFGSGARLQLSRMPLLTSGVMLSGICLGFLLYFAWLASEDRKMQTTGRASQCTIVDSLMLYEETTSGTGRNRGRSSSWKPLLALRYDTTQGSVISAGFRSPSALQGGKRMADRALEPFAVGNTVPCWYDPTNVKNVVVDRSFGGAYFFALIPLGVLLLGLAMIKGGIASLRRNR